MSSLDSSGDGQLDFEEFCQAFEHLVGKKDKVTSAYYIDETQTAFPPRSNNNISTFLAHDPV